MIAKVAILAISFASALATANRLANSQEIAGENGLPSAAELHDAWDVQRQSIHTAHLRLSYLVLIGADAKKCGAAEVERFCDQVSARINDGAIEGSANDHFDGLNIPASMKLVRTLEVVVAGDRVKNWRSQPQDRSVAEFQTSFDGVHGIWESSGNRQIDVYPGRAPFLTVGRESLFYVPPEGLVLGEGHLSRKIAGCFDVKAERKGKFSCDLTVDLASRAVRRFEIPGKRLHLQMAMEEFPGRVLFPRVVGDVLFNKGSENVVSIFLLEDARFNEEISPDAFSVTASPGTTLVDRRSGAPQTYRTSADYANVVQAVDELASRREIRTVIATQHSPMRISLLALNVGVLLVIAAALLLRRLRRA